VIGPPAPRSRPFSLRSDAPKGGGGQTPVTYPETTQRPPTVTAPTIPEIVLAPLSETAVNMFELLPLVRPTLEVLGSGSKAAAGPSEK
jgi:hypothetical protein